MFELRGRVRTLLFHQMGIMAMKQPGSLLWDCVVLQTVVEQCVSDTRNVHHAGIWVRDAAEQRQ